MKVLLFIAAMVFSFNSIHSDEFGDLTAKAEKGDKEAQYELANDYIYAENYTKAIEWMTRSAESGYAPAQSKLAQIYDDGSMVEADYTLAAKWYLKAAAQDNVDAQYGIGNLYYYGLGVKKDFVLAYMWTKISVSDQSRIIGVADEMKRGLEIISSEMTEAEIKQAENKVTDWISKNRKIQ